MAVIRFVVLVVNITYFMTTLSHSLMVDRALFE